MSMTKCSPAYEAAQNCEQCSDGCPVKHDLIRALRMMMEAFPAFTRMPVGAPGSAERIKQDIEIQAHMNARDVLKWHAA